MNFMFLANVCRQAFGKREAFYRAPNVDVYTAPKTLRIAGLGELKLVPMTKGFGDDYESYPIDAQHQGPAVEYFAPQPGKPRGQAPVNLKAVSSPGLMGTFAVVLPFLGVMVGLGIAHANPLVYVAGTLAIGVAAWFYAEQTDKMSAMYRRAYADLKAAA